MLPHYTANRLFIPSNLAVYFEDRLLSLLVFLLATRFHLLFVRIFIFVRTLLHFIKKCPHLPQARQIGCKYNSRLLGLLRYPLWVKYHYPIVKNVCIYHKQADRV